MINPPPEIRAWMDAERAAKRSQSPSDPQSAFREQQADATREMILLWHLQKHGPMSQEKLIEDAPSKCKAGCKRTVERLIKEGKILKDGDLLSLPSI